MDSLPLGLSAMDWIWLGLFALILALMAIGTYAIRRELRAAARVKATPVRLKTTEDQRRHWRLNKQCPPGDLINLLDDLDALLKRLEAS